MKNLPSSLMLLAAAVFGLGSVPGSPGPSVPGPETVFYGRIINRVTAQTYLVTEGTLTWRIRRPNGTFITLSTQLQPLKNGAYSYRLNVPHQALSVGLPVTDGAVPLGAQPTVCAHDQISVNGF